MIKSFQNTQKKISFFSLLFFSLIIVSCNDSNRDPKVVAENFYNSINDANYDDASKYANSETKDIIGQLKELNTIKEEIPYEFLEAIGIKDEYTSGDTVIVKYKIGKRKEEMNLVYDSEVFKVVDGKIGRIRKLKLTSYELYNLQIAGNRYEKGDKDIALKLKKRFGDIRFEISDLLLFKNQSGDDYLGAIAYDRKNNYSPLSECINCVGWGDVSEAGTICPPLFLNGKNVSIKKGVDKNRGFDLLYLNSFTFYFDDKSEIVDVSLASDITKTTQVPSWTGYSIDVPISFNFTKTYGIEGVFDFVGELREETEYAEAINIYFKECRFLE